ncbi:MAG TPA: DUF3667 domain-containing protein [Steroidobacteraceae bacterium]|nr:DUF3667 domain-containing protein [Steroidobacteraceae bacterium]
MSSPAPAAAAPQAAAAMPAPAPPAPGIRPCDNCGASVPGRYCGACGQRLEPPIHSLWHFLRAAAEDLTHADSRLWRTLVALLLQPGFLTREFLAGRRARYLPPVRLYLVLSVAFFLAAAVRHPQAEMLQLSTDRPGAVQVTPLGDAVGGAAIAGESAAGRARRECTLFAAWGFWPARLAPAVRDGCIRARADNGRSLQQAFLHNLPRAMFLFLPLLAALMKLLYRRPRHYYVEHLLLLVHNHALVFLVVMLTWVVGALVPPLAAWLGVPLFLYLLWYLYRSLRVAYGQGRALSAAKLLVLSFFYLVCGSMLVALTMVYSALTL